MAIKLRKLLFEAMDDERPDQSLDVLIRDTRIVDLSDYVYHGTPFDGLKSILLHGIQGTQHGEVAEYNTFSTSLNSGIIKYFSEGDGETGLSFKVKNIKVIVLDDILGHLITRLPGSGIDLKTEEDEDFLQFCEKYKIPKGRYDEHYLPYGYLSSIGADAFCYEYSWKRYQSGNIPYNDESEICFIGKGINKLNHCIDTIFVQGNEYAADDKVAALRAVEIRLEGDND